MSKFLKLSNSRYWSVIPGVTGNLFVDGQDSREKILLFIRPGFIIVKIFFKEVIPGASTRAHYSQEVLKPRCSGGLGKARIPKALDEAGEDRLGLGLHALSSF